MQSDFTLLSAPAQEPPANLFQVVESCLTETLAATPLLPSEIQNRRINNLQGRSDFRNAVAEAGGPERLSAGPALYIRAGGSQPLSGDQILEKTGCTPEDCLYGGFHLDPESGDLAGVRQGLLEQTFGWRQTKKLAVLGLINSLVFQAFRGLEGIRVALVTEDGKKIWQAVPRVVRQFFKGGQILLSTAVSWLAKNINGNWLAFAPGGAKSVTTETVRTYLQELRGLGLLDWVDQAFEPGRYGRCRLFTGLDFTRLCLLAEALETDLVEAARAALPADCEAGDEMGAALPPHFGTVTKIVYEAGIPGFGYRREGDPGETEPSSYAETDERAEALGTIKVEPPQAEPKLLAGEHLSAPLAIALAQLQQTVALCGWAGWVRAEAQKLRQRWQGAPPPLLEEV